MLILYSAIYWSLQGGSGRAEPSAASGGRSEAEAQCARELQEGAWGAMHNDLCALQKPPSRPLGFRRRQKNTKKPGPTLDGAGRHNPARRGLPPWGALVRCCANIAVRAGPGSGGTIPPAAGCCPGAPWPAVARISPSAQDRRPRRARCPRPTGSGGIARPPRAAGSRELQRTVREYRRARSTAARVAPPCA